MELPKLIKHQKWREQSCSVANCQDTVSFVHMQTLA